MSWYKGSAGNFTVTTTETFDEMIVMIVGGNQYNIAAQFAHPAKNGYTTLTKDGSNYTAMMTEAETREASEVITDGHL